MKLTRKEQDELGAVALRAVKEIDPTLTSKHLQKIIGRLYSKLLRDNKLYHEGVED